MESRRHFEGKFSRKLAAIFEGTTEANLLELLKCPGSNSCRYPDETLREIRGGTPGLILPAGI